MIVEFLKKVRASEHRKQDLLDRLVVAKRRTEIQGISFESDGSYTASKNTNANEKRIIEYVMLKDSVMKEIEQIEHDKIKAYELIDMLPDQYDRSIVERFYLKGMSQSEIGEELGFASPTIAFRKKKAILLLEQLYANISL